MIDLTRDLFDELASTRFLPTPARRQVLRTIGSEPVIGFVVQKGVHVEGDGEGLGTHVSVGVVTETRFSHITWHDEPAGGDEQDGVAAMDVASQVERYLADALQPAGGDLLTPPPPAPVRLVVSVQTVPLTQIVDVRTNHTYVRVGEGPYEPDRARVVVLCPTLDTLLLSELPCADGQCDNTHGMEGDAMQDVVVFAATVERDGDSTVEAVLAFAEALENAWAR